MDKVVLTKKRTTFEAEALPYLGEIYATARKMTKNVEMAEDLSAKTFEQSWKSFDQFRAGTNLRAWLYRILINTYINDYRKRQRDLVTTSIDENPEDFYIFNKMSQNASGRMGSPGSEVIKSFMEQDINRAFEELPEEFRIAVVLCDIRCFSYKEISEIIDVPIGTVRSRLNRGRRLLQKLLWDYSEKTGEKK